ncbi:MAG: hypothetical protein WCT18_01380 [Patescibacteria group bacterium]
MLNKEDLQVGKVVRVTSFPFIAGSFVAVVLLLQEKTFSFMRLDTFTIIGIDDFELGEVGMGIKMEDCSDEELHEFFKKCKGELQDLRRMAERQYLEAKINCADYDQRVAMFLAVKNRITGGV